MTDYKTAIANCPCEKLYDLRADYVLALEKANHEHNEPNSDKIAYLKAAINEVEAAIITLEECYS